MAISIGKHWGIGYSLVAGAAKNLQILADWPQHSRKRKVSNTQFEQGVTVLIYVALGLLLLTVWWPFYCAIVFVCYCLVYLLAIRHYHLNHHYKTRIIGMAVSGAGAWTLALLDVLDILDWGQFATSFIVASTIILHEIAMTAWRHVYYGSIDEVEDKRAILFESNQYSNLPSIFSN